MISSSSPPSPIVPAHYRRTRAGDVDGGTLPVVGNLDVEQQRLAFFDNSTRHLKPEISPHLCLPDVASDFDRLVCSDSGRAGFVQHPLRRVSGSFRVDQGSYDGEQGEKRKHNAGGARNEHPEGPLRHLFLGAKIAFCAVLLALVGLGYKVADRGLNALERRNWVKGLLLLGCGSILAV